MAFRATTLAAVAAALSAALLAGCGSTVKLDETPVETRTPTVVTASGSTATTGAATGSGAAAPQSRVATVDLDRSAGTPAGAGASGAVAPAATLGRLVYFDFDSFVVKDEFRPLVEGHAKALAAAKTRRLVVEGHTDERGGREYNLALGQKRAEAVAKSLVLLGATDAQIEAVSFGKERPADPGHDEDAWAKNRRAELKDR